MMNKSILTKFSSQYGVDEHKMLSTLKTVAFKQSNGVDISNEQMIALLVVADQYKLNPFTKEIYAFPDKGAIVPVVGVDGWSRIINSHPQFDGMEYKFSNESVSLEGGKTCPEWIECVMYRKDRSNPTTVREYIDEVYRPAFTNKYGKLVIGPWQTHTKRMLRHKVTIQCARLAFGFVGIYDEDEADRIIEAEKDITPRATDQQKQRFQSLINNSDSIGMLEFMGNLPDVIQAELYNSFPAGEKVKGKQLVSGMISKASTAITEYADTIMQYASEEYEGGVRELKSELTETEEKLVLPRLDDRTKEYYENLEV